MIRLLRLGYPPGHVVDAKTAGEAMNVTSSIGDIAGLTAMVIGVPAAAIASIMLIRYIRQRRASRRKC